MAYSSHRESGYGSLIGIPMESSGVTWGIPPSHLVSGRDEVHVWRAELTQKASHVQALLEMLAPDEEGRAGRFLFQRDRDRFIVARGFLRLILSRYLHTEPHRLRFAYSPYGKPSLAQGFHVDRLRFNVSHSENLALYAIAWERELGVDIEYVRADFASDEIAGHFFSRGEASVLRALPPNARTEAFFKCWTRKEAYIKARGEGLSIHLDKFEVAFSPGEAAALLHFESDPLEPSRWLFRDLNPGHGYAAALVVEGGGWRLQCWGQPSL